MGKKNFIGKLLEKGKIKFYKKLVEKSPSIRVGIKEMSPPVTGVVYIGGLYNKPLWGGVFLYGGIKGKKVVK